MEKATSSEPTQVWLVLADMFSIRTFFDSKIIDLLANRLGPRLELVVLVEPTWTRGRLERVEGLHATQYLELFPWKVGLAERVGRRADIALDSLIGFYPLAVRFNLRHGFHQERMRPGHDNGFLDSARVGPLPRWEAADRLMLRWHFSARRYVSHALVKRMRSECSAVVVSNLQSELTVPFLNAARRLHRPVVGYVASWDHPVGKGVVSPHLDTYIVQNDVMRDELGRYHGVDPAQVEVTGWPQSDAFFQPRPREEFDGLLTRLGLNPVRPVVLVMGNTPTNTPYEPAFFERLLGWWESSRANERFSLLFRPHPRDHKWEERFAPVVGRVGAAVEPQSEATIESLAVMLAHGSCVVSNAGTILLDSLTNDRPAVCVLYDEGAPLGETWAALNVLGAHYRELMSSNAFYRAESFDEVVAGIERALADPGELSAERRRVAHEVVGELDGKAGERVCDAIVRAATTR